MATQISLILRPPQSLTRGNGSGQNPKRGARPQLVSDRGSALRSADGGGIAYRSEREGGGILLMSVNGDDVRLPTDFGFHSTWSPNGDEVTFGGVVGCRPSVPARASQSLLRLNTDAGAKKMIHDDVVRRPSWSPNGQWVAFAVDTSRQIWIISAEGGGPAPLIDKACPSQKLRRACRHQLEPSFTPPSWLCSANCSRRGRSWDSFRSRGSSRSWGGGLAGLGRGSGL